jgi:peroxiredoxin
VSADESLREASAFAKEVKATFPVVHDVKGKMNDQFGVEGLPANVIVGRDGKVVASIDGVDEKALDAAVEKAVGAK